MSADKQQGRDEGPGSDLPAENDSSSDDSSSDDTSSDTSSEDGSSQDPSVPEKVDEASEESFPASDPPAW